MESAQKPNPHSRNREDDIDLGLVIHKTGNVLNKVSHGLGKFFSGISTSFLLFLFFLRRNLLWLLIGTIIGFGYGLFLLSKKGPKYYSQMTVKTNFNSASALYGAVDYLNSMISSNQITQLARILHVNPTQASTLVNIEASPVRSELIIAQLYRDQFLTLQRNEKFRMDTFWTKTIKYNDFKNSLTDNDFPLHEVTVTSTSADIYPHIQQGILDLVSQNQLLQQIRENGIESNEQDIEILVSSIRGIDSLRETYNKRLETSPPVTNPGNNVYMLDRSDTYTSPELQLYDKLLELKDELKKARNRAAVEQNVLEVYSPFNAFGKKESFFKQTMIKYALLGLLGSFLLVVVFAIYRELGKAEKNYRKAI